MTEKISRRRFFRKGFGLGAGALFINDIPHLRIIKGGKIPE